MNFVAVEPLSRRRLLATLAASSPLLIAQRRRASHAAKRIDRATLTALAEAILPSAIETAGAAAAVDGFDRWLSGYRGGAELLHGYGSSEVRYTPASPAPRFEADLVALERAARDRHGEGFAQLPADQRRALVTAAIEPHAEAALPPIARAKHVAIALIAFWAESPAGFDVGYGARIGRLGCRPLATNPDRPAGLRGV